MMGDDMVMCINTGGYIGLRFMEMYPLIKDEAAEKCGMYRVVDDYGEDFLYPKSLFAFVGYSTN